MNVTHLCRACERTVRSEFDANSTEIVCSACGHATSIPAGAMAQRDDGAVEVTQCLVCPSTDLFARKNFPQHIGVTVVVIGLAASCIPWYFRNWWGTFAVLGATALIDLCLFLFLGNVVQCYRCQAQYRGVEGAEDQGAFNLEVHEKHRQQVARMGQEELKIKN